MVDRVVEISYGGKAPKNDPAIVCLALAMKKGNEGTRQAAREAVSKVARTGTSLFDLARSVEAFGGWGRGTKRAFANWYQSKSLSDAAYQAVKYQQREGWSHRDILRLAHPTPDSEGRKALYKWITKGDLGDFSGEGLEIIQAFEMAKKATNKKEIIALIKSNGLTREMIPTQFLAEADVWEAMLEKMPIHAMVRNLANMTRLGLIAPLSAATKFVVSALDSADKIQKSRLHPISVLSALLAYKSGGEGSYTKSQNTWGPVSTVVDALDGAFYKAFKNVEPAGKRTLLALDVSGSMTCSMVAGIPGLTARDASAAMSLVTAATEKDHHFIGFTASGSGTYGGRWGGGNNGVTSIDISPKMRLDKVVKAIEALPMGGTDCALPMIWAQQNKVEVDTFCVYTDNETWAGKIHPFQALKDYRNKTGINAKLVVIATEASEFTIADPSDRGMLDICGFSTDTPAVINSFSRGDI